MDSHVRWESPPISQHALLLLVSGRIFPKLTSMSLTSKGVFPAKYTLPNEKIPAIICKFLDRPVKAIVTVHMDSLLEQTDSTVYLPPSLPIPTNLANFPTLTF